MAKKRQHIVPQVYLRGFGFKKPEFNNKWFVSVINKGRSTWHNREIKRFLSSNNIYTLPQSTGYDPLLIENNLHGAIESRLPKIIETLNQDSVISPNCKFAIIETMANFLCRSKRVLQWLKHVIVEKEEELLEFIVSGNYIFETKEKSDDFIEYVMKLREVEKINIIMTHFMQRIKITLLQMKITIFKCHGDFMLFTSDNPVVHLNAGFGEFKKCSTQLLFALNKEYLVYLYWDKKYSEIESIQPLVIENTIQFINEEFINYFCKKIVPSFSDEFIIAPMEVGKRC